MKAFFKLMFAWFVLIPIIAIIVMGLVYVLSAMVPDGCKMDRGHTQDLIDSQ